MRDVYYKEFVVSRSKRLRWKQNVLEGNLLDMERGERGGKESDGAQRARLLREALGYRTAKSFADHLGISEQRWSNVENGLPIGKSLALTVCQRVPGMTTDWLFLGIPHGLPFELATRLGAHDSARKGKTRA